MEVKAEAEPDAGITATEAVEGTGTPKGEDGHGKLCGGSAALLAAELVDGWVGGRRRGR